MLNLYVGNLPYSMNDQELNDLFSEIGDVQSARVMSDRETGRSRGFGFVEMADDDAGHQAIEKLNGNDIDGRALVVNEARPREERPRGGGFGGGGGGGRGGYGGGGGGGGGYGGGGGGRSSGGGGGGYGGGGGGRSGGGGGGSYGSGSGGGGGGGGRSGGGW